MGERGFKLAQSFSRPVQFQKKIAELLSRGNNRSRGDGAFFQGIFFFRDGPQ